MHLFIFLVDDTVDINEALAVVWGFSCIHVDFAEYVSNIYMVKEKYLYVGMIALYTDYQPKPLLHYFTQMVYDESVGFFMLQFEVLNKFPPHGTRSCGILKAEVFHSEIQLFLS